MTSTNLESDLTVIEHLDFEPTCDVEAREAGECDRAAEWVVVLATHCGQRGTIRRLWCDEHLQQAMTYQAVCSRCRDVVLIKPHIISTDRLKP